MKSMIFLLLLFEIIFCTQSDRKFYRCGYGNKKFDPKPLNDLVVSNKKNSSYSRILEEDDGFKDLNIYFDFENLKSHAQEFGISDSYLTMIINSINKATKTLGSLLRVVPPVNTPCSPATIQSYGIDSWNQTFPIFMSPARKGMRDIGVDMVIFGKFDNSLEDDVFASSEAKGYDPNNDRIITGVLYINSKINLEKTHSDRYLTTIMLHELTHLLGFEINFINHNGFFKQERDSQGILHNYITSPKVIEVAKKYFKCDNDIKGIEVEDSVGSISSYSHWDARYLLGEYMNYKIYTEEEVISEFTLAFLEDIKYFKAKYYTGGLMRYGKGKGCEFLLGDCINRNTEKTPFKNEFFDSVTSQIKGKNNYYYDAACSSGRQSKVYHYFLRFDAAPASYIYFKDNIIGSQYTNGCPVGQLSESETENDYYTGRCSSLGSKGDYGYQIYYQYEGPENVDGRTIWAVYTYYNSSAEMLDYTGETYSDHSHCYQSSLYKNSLSLKQEVTRAVCYESFCSNRSLTIKIFNDYFVCPRKGGKVLVEGYKGMFFCPDYYLVCSGTVMCNDMYDCVDKKSEAKEDSYNYDYIPETNQMLSEIEGSAEDNTNNYELSDDGICPQYCKKCLDNKVCVICKENCYELRSKTNSAFKGCLPYELAKIGYYKENNQNIYYKCLDKCEKCTTGTNCQKCIDGYSFISERCIKIIDNCLNYALDYCEECNGGYAFKEDNKLECLNIANNFQNHYTKDEGISYYPCNNEISNCNQCYYNSGDKEVKCYLCDTNFAMFENDNKCLNKESLDNSYININDTHVKLCENVINYCKECTNEKTCTKCSNGFLLSMTNDGSKYCINESILQSGEVYLSEDDSTYLYCSEPAYHDIPNCHKCSDKTSCSLCKSQFTFIDGDKSKCVEINSLSNNYIKDPKDSSNYIKCENIYGNCNTCNNERCLTCQEKYEFVNNDYSTCVEIIIPPTQSNISPTNENTNKPNEDSTNKPNKDSTNKPNEESTNKPNEEEEETENDNNGTPVITKDEALQKASISLSYEKINNFNYNKDEKKINYDLSVLTTVGEIKTGDEINVNVNLIYSNGTRSTESVESTCKVQNLEEQSSTVRATFLCTIENVEGDYYSLRYNSSDNICGVPKDETSLDPVLTKKYKNNDDTKILPSFSYESIDHNTCRSTGIFTIKGKMSEKINENIKFTFPLTYPEGISLTCQFNEEQDELTCKPDRDIIDKAIIIEQTVISQGNVDYFNLKSITSSERLICSNGILKESEEKSNVPITFRQVSHIQRDTNGFSFILIALASEKIEQGTSIQANIYVNNEKIDRTIDCILQNNVNPDNGQTQGNFLCSADKNTNDYWNSIDFSNISVSLSPNNDNIGGVAELDETSANPSKTDEEISKIKEKKQNNEEINSLTNVIDYYEENNEINTFTLESIDVDKCNTTGKLKIKGSFSNDFEEEINFDLPLTYPNVELKCELKKVTQKTVINIECKSKSDFKSVDSIVIEPRIIKKKNQELFMINGKTFKLNGKRSCANYDTIKNEILENRENSEVAFAAMSALAVVNQALEFLMGFSKESENAQFPDIYTFLTSLTLSTRRRLRILEETTISDIPITCNLNQSLVVGLIGGYNCGSDTKNIQGTPLSMKFDTDDIMDIAGIDNINLQTTSSNNIDFTNIENLKIMNELPQVDINSIDGNTCSENGQYIIYGNISSVSNVEILYSDIEILISSTESTSLCEVEINKNNNNLTMICQNKDKFDMSRIMISKSFVKNSTGNFIFIINSYTSPEQFACDISLNSVKITTVEDEDKESNIYDSGNRFSMRTAGTNISAGTIVAIVIPIVVGLIAVIIVFILMKKGILSGKKDETIGESTIKRLDNEPGITH